MKSLGSTIFSETDKSSNFIGSSGTHLLTKRLRSRHKRFLTLSVQASYFKIKLKGLQQTAGSDSFEIDPSFNHFLSLSIFQHSSFQLINLSAVFPIYRSFKPLFNRSTLQPSFHLINLSTLFSVDPSFNLIFS